MSRHDWGSARFVLASRSPRRRALLEGLGLRFELCPVDLEERPRAGEHPGVFARRMALEKAAAARARLGTGPPVLAADTVVTVDGEVLGKPADPGEAESMLGRLSGRSHEVLSAVAVAAARTEWRVSASRVWFRALTADERRAYAATGEGLDKAGGYAIQGFAATFVTRLAGSYSGVVGLPLFETAELLARAGIDVLPRPGVRPSALVTPRS